MEWHCSAYSCRVPPSHSNTAVHLFSFCITDKEKKNSTVLGDKPKGWCSFPSPREKRYSFSRMSKEFWWWNLVDMDMLWICCEISPFLPLLNFVSIPHQNDQISTRETWWPGSGPPSSGKHGKHQHVQLPLLKFYWMYSEIFRVCSTSTLHE